MSGNACHWHDAGTSSFGLSGVNAHLLLSASPAAAPPPSGAPAMPWSAQRFWPAPPACALLTAHLSAPPGAGSTGSIRFAALIEGSAALAFLWDHRVGGRALMPATGFFELASAAAAALAIDGASPAAAEALALTAVAILGPKVLQPAGGSGSSDMNALSCEVQPTSGQLTVASAAQTPAPPHLTCRCGVDCADVSCCHVR